MNWVYKTKKGYRVALNRTLFSAADLTRLHKRIGRALGVVVAQPGGEAVKSGNICDYCEYENTQYCPGVAYDEHRSCFNGRELVVPEEGA